MSAPFAALEARINSAVFSRLANARAEFSATEAEAIFDEQYLVADASFAVSGASPALSLLTSDVPAGPIGQTVTVNDAQYAIVEHLPDGTGWSVLRLRRA